MLRLFLCHASEDKDDFVRPLAERLEIDFKVWYDEYTLTLGDSLLQKINEGLKSSNYGVVVLSKAFFSKLWTKAELEGLFSLESDNKKVILPVWHNVDVDEVRGFSPILAGRLGVKTETGLDNVVREIKVAVGLADRQRSLGNGVWKQNFLELDQDIIHKKASDELSRSIEGVQKVEQVARAIIAEAKSRAELLVRENSELRVHLVDTNDWHIPKDLSAAIESQ
jgi:TIR domain